MYHYMRLFILLGLCLPALSQAQLAPLRLYIDADRTVLQAAGHSIEWGVRTALSEVDNQLGNRPVEVVIRDHRGNNKRSLRHLQEYLRDENALAVVAGLHSPPLIAHRDLINANEILVLDPWAAAAPITRPPGEQNWIFRLSIDDSKAGRYIARYSARDGFSKPYLLLEETGWGRSNEGTMQAALRELGLSAVGTDWFKWGLSETGARMLVRRIAATGADVIFLVANAPEGKSIVSAMASLPPGQRLPIRSHWGITGGDFAQALGDSILSQIDLHFLQTRFSFLSPPVGDLGAHVLARARQLGFIETQFDLRTPTGFIHAYDLTHLLIAAVHQAGPTGDIATLRHRVHAALEDLRTPVRGLIKTYARPFAPYTPAHPDAHEALGADDLRMAQYGKGGAILLVE
jgi:branched-chain amino acid transport system substrate-binding protein